MIDDVVGWLALSLLLGPVRGGAVNGWAFAKTVLLGGLFAAGLLVLGRRIIDAALRHVAPVERVAATASGRVLSLVILLALFGAAATQAIGLHAIFGGFIVGLTVGGSSRINERTRLAIEDFVVNVFAPVFFASIGLRVDFVAAFDLRLTLLVLVLATLPKLLGCSLGARAGGLKWRQAVAVGFDHPGALSCIAAALAARGFSLEDVQVSTYLDPSSGGADAGPRFFVVVLRVGGPAGGQSGTPSPGGSERG